MRDWARMWWNQTEGAGVQILNIMLGCLYTTLCKHGVHTLHKCLLNKGRMVHLAKAMVFPVVMYGCESWTTKKAECRRIDAFELWYWRRILRVPWTARGSNQFILKEISPEYSLEGLMLKLKLQYFGHQMQKTNSFEKMLMGWERWKAEEEDDRGWDGWMASPTRWTWAWTSSGSWWWTGRPGMLRVMGSQRVGHDWATDKNWNGWESRRGKQLDIEQSLYISSINHTSKLYWWNNKDTSQKPGRCIILWINLIRATKTLLEMKQTL